MPEADVFLLIDGDGTLCAQDSGALFFDQASTPVQEPLRKIFQRYERYSFRAFWDVAMLYGNVLSDHECSSLCKKIGTEQVQVFDAWKVFLDQLPSNVHPVLVSCGIREVWFAMQAHHVELHGQACGLGRMTIVAGNRLSHPYLIDDTAKALVANTLRTLHGGCRILSFGDSGKPLCESHLLRRPAAPSPRIVISKL